MKAYIYINGLKYSFPNMEEAKKAIKKSEWYRIFEE